MAAVSPRCRALRQAYGRRIRSFGPQKYEALAERAHRALNPNPGAQDCGALLTEAVRVLKREAEGWFLIPAKTPAIPQPGPSPAAAGEDG